MSDQDNPPPSGRRTLRYSPGFDHRGDEAQLPRLRHERDRGARAAGCARRAQAGASAHPLFDARERLRVEQAVPQIGARRRRRHRQISSARRPVDLRRAGAHGAGFLHAPAADRRPGQFRLGRRRCAGGHALHRSAAGEGRAGAARRSRQGHRRLPGQLRQFRARAGGAAGALSQSAGQRRRRHRGRHGDQHPAAQSRRGDRRLRGADRQSGAVDRRSDRHRAGTGFPDRRHHSRPPGHPRRLSSRPRLHRHARQGRIRDAARRARGDRHLRNSLSGEQGASGRAHRRTGARQEDRGHRRAARRIRPRRLPRRDRTAARRGAGRGAQPALPLHARCNRRSAPTWWRSTAAGRW